MSHLHRHIMLDDIPSRYFEKVVRAIAGGAVAYALNPKDLRERHDCLAVRTLEREQLLVYADSSTLTVGSHRLRLADVIEDLPEAKPFTAWGVELPPVGTECIVSIYDPHVFSDEAVTVVEKFDGKQVTIVAHDENRAVFRIKAEGGNVYHSMVAGYFKPLKSKREQDIDALIDALNVKYYPNVEIAPLHVHRASRGAAEFAYDFIVSRIGGES